MACRVFRGHPDLPLHGNAWLYRFEQHAFAVGRALREGGGGVAGGLARALEIPSTPLRTHVFCAGARVFEIWRWRDRPALDALADDPLVDFLSSQLDTEVGESVARMLVALHQARACPEVLARVVPEVRARMADFDDATRATLASWVDSRGVPSRTAGARTRRRPPPEDVLTEIRRATAVDALIAWCKHDDPRIAHEATLRLVEIGEPGLRALVALLATAPPCGAIVIVTDSIAIWPDGPWLDALDPVVDDASRPAEVRFRVGLALLERGDLARLPAVIASALEGSAEPWVRSEDADRLFAAFEDPLPLARALASSPHPHLYRRAVERVLEEESARHRGSTSSRRAAGAGNRPNRGHPASRGARTARRGGIRGRSPS